MHEIGEESSWWVPSEIPPEVLFRILHEFYLEFFQESQLGYLQQFHQGSVQELYLQLWKNTIRDSSRMSSTKAFFIGYTKGFSRSSSSSYIYNIFSSST